MTHIPAYEEACAAKHAGAEQPQMAAGQYWYNQFGVLWKIQCKASAGFLVQKVGTDVLSGVNLENYDSVIYAGSDPISNEIEK